MLHFEGDQMHNIGATMKLSAATILAGWTSAMAEILGLIPNDIAKLVSLISGILAVVMILVWVKKLAQIDVETKIKRLEYQQMLRESNYKRRKTDNDPTDSETDS